VAFLIDAVGWRMAFVGLGLLPLVTSLPLVYFLFRDIDDPKVPEAQKKVLAEKSGQEITGMLASSVFKDWRFWLMSVCFVAISFGVGGLIPNLENLFSTKGFDKDDAIILASLIGVSVVVGRLSGGFLIDHFWAPGVAVCMLVVPAISCYFLAQADLTFTIAAIAVLLIGLSAGAEQDLMAFMVARYFGMKSYGVVYGVLYSCFALGAGSGPWLLGREFAATGTYDNALLYVGIAFIVGSLPLLLLGKYRDFSMPAKA
jgi:predicted MFS family arabinose efflux permease